MIKKEEMSFLAQLGDSLREAEIKLSEAYNNGDYESLNKTKRFILQLQRRINDIIR